MTKRLSDTEALKSQSLREAGIELASEKSPYWDEPNRLEPAYQSADYAVDAEKRRKEREDRMNSPCPPMSVVTQAERAENRRNNSAGNSKLSAAVKICKE